MALPAAASLPAVLPSWSAPSVASRTSSTTWKARPMASRVLGRGGARSALARAAEHAPAHARRRASSAPVFARWRRSRSPRLTSARPSASRSATWPPMRPEVPAASPRMAAARSRRRSVVPGRVAEAIGHEHVEGAGEQRIAGQDGDGLAEDLVRGRLAAPQVVVVHGRQVVVDEAVGVDHLHRAGQRHQRLVGAAHRLPRGQHQQGADALAAREEAVAHGAMDGGRPIATRRAGRRRAPPRSTPPPRLQRRRRGPRFSVSPVAARERRLARGGRSASRTRSPRASFRSSSILPSASSSLAWHRRESRTPSS